MICLFDRLKTQTYKQEGLYSFLHRKIPSEANLLKVMGLSAAQPKQSMLEFFAVFRHSCTCDSFVR